MVAGGQVDVHVEYYSLTHSLAHSLTAVALHNTR
jgi:hypothetical protein